MGRRSVVSEETLTRIRELKQAATSSVEISRILNRDGVPSPSRQGQWSRQAVDRVLKSENQIVQDLRDTLLPQPKAEEAREKPGADAER